MRRYWIALALTFSCLSGFAAAEPFSHQPVPVAGKKTQEALGVSEKAVRDQLLKVPGTWKRSTSKLEDGVRRSSFSYELGQVDLYGLESNISKVIYIGKILTPEDNNLTNDQYVSVLLAHAYVLTAILSATFPAWEKPGEWVTSNLTGAINQGSSATYSQNGKQATIGFTKALRMIIFTVAPE